MGRISVFFGFLFPALSIGQAIPLSVAAPESVSKALGCLAAVGSEDLSFNAKIGYASLTLDRKDFLEVHLTVRSGAMAEKAIVLIDDNTVWIADRISYVQTEGSWHLSGTSNLFLLRQQKHRDLRRATPRAWSIATVRQAARDCVDISQPPNREIVSELLGCIALGRYEDYQSGDEIQISTTWWTDGSVPELIVALFDGVRATLFSGYVLSDEISVIDKSEFRRVAGEWNPTLYNGGPGRAESLRQLMTVVLSQDRFVATVEKSDVGDKSCWATGRYEKRRR